MILNELYDVLRALIENEKALTADNAACLIADCGSREDDDGAEFAANCEVIARQCDELAKTLRAAAIAS